MNPRRPIKVGTFVPTGTKGQLTSIDSTQDQWRSTRATAVMAERLGFDSFWVADHLHNAPLARNETLFEAFTVLGALAEATTTIRLGTLVAVSAFRRPSMLAKIGATLDVLSGGRFELGIGNGWYEGEHEAHGIPLLAPSERVAEMAETIEVVARLWSEPSVDFAGRFHRLSGAQCDPKPLQQPRPPIWVGGGGERFALGVAARWADRANFDLVEDADDWAHKRDVLFEHCARIGRDPTEIELTWNADLVIRDTEAEVLDAAGRASSLRGDALTTWCARNLVGTPAQLIEVLGRYAELGCTYFVVGATEPADLHLTSLQIFAEEVMPTLS